MLDNFIMKFGWKRVMMRYMMAISLLQIVLTDASSRLDTNQHHNATSVVYSVKESE